MALQRIILELGSGNDLHGGDYTKAALRAVQDALHHSSLSLSQPSNQRAGFASNPSHGDAAPSTCEAPSGGVSQTAARSLSETQTTPTAHALRG